MKEEIKPMERLTREPIAFAPGAALFGPDAGRDALPEGRGDRQLLGHVGDSGWTECAPVLGVELCGEAR